MFQKITPQRLQKLGNTLIYFAMHVGEFNKTKALKLLFLLEESSVKKFGQPMLGFPFHVWQYGPVIADVYVDLNEDAPSLLENFIQRTSINPQLFEAKQEFNDDFFSDNEIGLLEDIVKFAKSKTATDLIEITHKPGSLWHTIAQRNDVLEALEKQHIPTTDLTIDFSVLFENDLERREHYLEAVENYELIHQLKC
jgi:uncharacterized phage-associated protein